MASTTERDWTTVAGLRAVCLMVIRDYEGKTIRSHRCGYVGVPVGHPLHGVDYGTPVPWLRRYTEHSTLGKKSPILIITAGVRAEEGDTVRCSPDIAFDVHGGLTFSDGGGGYPVSGPEWWFGFDCHHDCDRSIDPSPYGFDSDGVVRSMDYVVAECESLARQIVEMSPMPDAPGAGGGEPR